MKHVERLLIGYLVIFAIILLIFGFYVLLNAISRYIGIEVATIGLAVLLLAPAAYAAGAVMLDAREESARKYTRLP